MSKEWKGAIRDVSNGKIAGLYLLVGEEEWSRKKFLTHLKNTLVDESMVDFNYDLFSAESVKAVAVVDKARVLPMMADHRLIVVENCDQWKAKDFAALVAYCDDLNTQTSLVLTVKSAGNRKLFKIKKPGILRINFEKPKRWELNGYIGELAADMKLRIEPEAIAVVAEMAGDDLAKVHQELEKLSLYKLGSNVITAADAELLMGRTRQVTRWELNDFIGKRDMGATLVKMHDIFDSGEEPIGLLSTINMFLKQLMTVKALMTRGMNDRGEIARALGLPPRIAEGLINQQKNYSAYELRRAFKLMKETDFRLKSAGMNRRLILDQLITQVMHRSAYSPPSGGRRR